MEIDFQKVLTLQQQGYIGCQKHPTFPLLIWNYTNRTQFERMWTPETVACRGLITDLNFNIVARPFQKFFNLEEHQGALPGGKFEVYEKIDGSLGILYFVGGKPFIATRGSFVSEQALHATKVLHDKYKFVQFNPAFTYLFEIVFPDNQIVVNYGSIDDLFMLAVIETKTGEELSLLENCPSFVPMVRPHLEAISDLSNLRETVPNDREGFVVKWPNGFRIKVKGEEYRRLHRLVFGVNSKTIWEMLKEGESLEELLNRVPDEFYQWVKVVDAGLRNQYSLIEEECLHLYGGLLTLLRARYKNLDKKVNRKEIAEAFVRTRYADILFQMLDDQDYSQAIWKRVRPKASKPFRVTNEDVA